jgi:hypothetical protein
VRGGELLATAWLKNEFARSRVAPEIPNGKPLWHWRATEAERRRILKLLSPHLPPSDPPDRHQAALFCLFAAETLRRNWRGGPRSWAIVTDALGVTLSQHKCCALTTVGLRYWGRRLRHGDKSTQYLHSLVLEGGIPDALLTGDVDAFGRFLRAALADIEAYRAEDRNAALRQIDAHRAKLPGTWQDDEIFELVADLLLGITRIRQRSRHLQPEALIVWLETSQEWQADLPLDIASEQVRKLLVSLIVQPRRQTSRTLTRLCYRALVRHGDGWRSTVVLESGGQFPASALGHPVLMDDRVTRVRLFLDVGPDAGAAIAMLERDGDGMARFRALQVRPLTVSWNQAVAVRMQCDGLEQGTLILPGGEPLPAAPWVMEDDAEDADPADDIERLRVTGTGSRRTRRPVLYLAVDAGQGQLTDPDVTWLGDIEGTARSVARISNSCLWHQTASGLALQFVPGDTADEEHPLALHPIRPSWSVMVPFVSLGPPGVASAGGALSWRRTHTDKWKPIESWPTGRLELALLRGNVVWDTGEIVVLPATARIWARRAGDRRTAVHVIHLGPDVVVEGPTEVERTPIPGGFRITVEWQHLPEPVLTVRTRLESDAQALRHKIRVPIGPGAIERNGSLLTTATLIRFTDLGDCLAVSGGEDGSSAELVVRVHGGAEHPTVIDRIAFVDEVPLHILRRRLLRQFATVGKLDSDTRIHVEREGIGGRHIEVKPYGWLLRADYGRRLCWVLDGDDLSDPFSVEMVAVSVIRPEADAVTLSRCMEEAWALPEAEFPDTWLVLGSGRARGWFRPMLWISGPAAVAPGSLCSLALIADFDARQSAFDQAMQTIVAGNDDRTADGLRYLLDLVRLARRHLIPALSLDALRSAARHPGIPVRLLWEADDTTIQDVVELEDELPFLWCLSDPAILREMVKRFLHTLRDVGLPEADAIEAADAKLTQLSDRCPQLAAACWVAREGNRIPHHGNEEAPLAQLRLLRDHLRSIVGTRRTTDAEWRRLVAATHDWQNFPEDVKIDAPAYAAGLVSQGLIRSERDVAVLRHVREQDTEDFNLRFRVAFQFAVATTGTLP